MCRAVYVVASLGAYIIEIIDLHVWHCAHASNENIVTSRRLNARSLSRYCTYCNLNTPSYLPCVDCASAMRPQQRPQFVGGISNHISRCADTRADFVVCVCVVLVGLVY